MTAKEWIFKNYPQVEEEWDKTGHDDSYMVRMMEEYHQAKLKLLGIANVVGQREQLPIARCGCEEPDPTSILVCVQCDGYVE